MIEEWKEIEGSNGRYFVSDAGQVKSVFNGKETILAQNPNRKRNGYLTVMLKINGKKKFRLVHRLVIEAFVPKPTDKGDPDKLECHHIDEDKWNNSKFNLCWVTRKENLNAGTRNERISSSLINKLIGYNEEGKAVVFNGANDFSKATGIHLATVYQILVKNMQPTGEFLCVRDITGKRWIIARISAIYDDEHNKEWESPTERKKRRIRENNNKNKPHGDSFKDILPTDVNGKIIEAKEVLPMPNEGE